MHAWISVDLIELSHTMSNGDDQETPTSNELPDMHLRALAATIYGIDCIREFKRIEARAKSSGDDSLDR